ncbi:MAG: hypothetical protein H6577_03935 [Lewinellaceae bacterium]|nr:hypothetical protein [Saprospiraceae bacterium]MCB9337254.1 hypothetical protein [Lewinellaceae bacterium]
MGFQKIALATDPFQTWFLRRFARKQALSRQDVGFLPIQYDSLRAGKYGDPKIPYWEAYVEGFVPLRIEGKIIPM